jgi:drug/metabolite transporter (DMT)-like permease
VGTGPLKSGILPIAAAAMCGFLVGAAIVATRSVVDQAGPASLALLRYAIGFSLLATPALLGPRVHVDKRDLLPIAALGVVQFGVLIALLNYSLQFIGSAHAALIFATMPLLTMLLAALLGHERLSLAKALGVLLSIAGVGIVSAEKLSLPAATANVWIGVFAALASALCGAVCSVLYRPYVRKYPALPVSAFAMLASVAFLALLAAGEGFFSAFPHFTLNGWFAVLFIGANSGLGYFLWLWALAHTTATRVTIFMALSPVTAGVLGALFLGEATSPLLLLAVAFVVLGLWLAHREDRAPQPLASS